MLPRVQVVVTRIAGSLSRRPVVNAKLNVNLCCRLATNAVGELEILALTYTELSCQNILKQHDGPLEKTCSAGRNSSKYTRQLRN